MGEVMILGDESTVAFTAERIGQTNRRTLGRSVSAVAPRCPRALR
jgi:hypothetical protein